VQASLQTRNCFCQPESGKGLEEIVDGLLFERVDRKLVVGGNEYPVTKTLTLAATSKPVIPGI
jgi:hypothetical protein